MCKRQAKSVEFREQPVAGYTGETINLGSERVPTAAAKSRQCANSSFPFWTLWLIWPLFGLLKGALPFIAGSVAVLSQFVMLLLPLVLIVIGIMLLRRS